MTNEQACEVLQEVIPNSKFGFPVIAFKAAALDAGFQQGALVRNAGTASLAKSTARGAFHIISDESYDEYAVIEGTPTIREDMVCIGGINKTAFVCYHAEFKTWSTELLIRFNKQSISMEQIANLFKLDGFSNGVGEWRPSRNSPFGTFHIE